VLLVENDIGLGKPENSCWIDGVQEIWDRRRRPVGEDDFELRKERSGDARKELLHASTGTFEAKPSEVWECSVYHCRCMGRLFFGVIISKRSVKSDLEFPQLGHEGKALEKLVEVKVNGWAYGFKGKCDKARGSRKYWRSNRKGKMFQCQVA